MTVAPDGHTRTVTSCAVARHDRRVISTSEDQTIKIWDCDTGHAVATLRGHTDIVTSCAVTRDGARMVSASDDGTLRLWDLDAGATIATLQAHAGWVKGCAVTPDGRRAISASDDGTLKVWDLETGLVVVTMTGHRNCVRSCAVTREARRVVSTSDDSTLKVWDLETGAVITTLDGHAGNVRSCVVAPDGRHVVSASDDGTLKVWDLDTGRVIGTLEGHTGAVTGCAIAPDGRWLVSASSDRTLKIWDLAIDRCLVTHRGDTHFTTVIASANMICAGDAAGTIWFLDWPSAMPRQPHEQALADARSAVVLYRRLATDDPGAFQPRLATSLCSLGTRLAGLGHGEPAVNAFREAAELHRALAADRPEAFQPELADSLSDLGMMLAAADQRKSALAAAREAVDLHRLLAAHHRNAFQAELARSLSNLASMLSAVGQRGPALDAMREAVELRSALATQNPGAFQPGLATSLNALSAMLSAMGEHERALASAREAVDLRRALAAEDPDTFRAELARSLSNLGAMLNASGQREPALAAAREAVALQRELVLRDPGMFQAQLAQALTQLGNFASDLGQRELALDATRDAVACYRALAHRNPDAFQPDLAASMNNLAGRMSELGRQDAAFQAAREAVDLYRTLVARSPDAFEPAFASSLSNLSNVLVRMEQHAAAVQIDREVVELYRKLATRSPEGFLPYLVTSLNHLSGRMADAGQSEAAVATSREATDLYRLLVTRNPDAFQPNFRGLGAGGFVDLWSDATEFLRAAGFTLRPTDQSDDFDTRSRSPFWRAKYIHPQLFTRILAEKALTGDEVLRIRESAAEVAEDITQAFVVLNGSVQDDAWAQRATLRIQGFNVMPIPYTVLYEARTSNTPDVEQDVLAAHLERFLGTGKDPYDVRDPVSDSLDFFGREAIADNLSTMLAEGKPIGVFGLRKMGKSSLLRYLQSRLPFPTARLDLQAGAEPGGLLQRAMRAWETDVRARFNVNLAFGGGDVLDGAASVDVTVHAIQGFLDQHVARIPGRRLGILLDEIELLTPGAATPEVVLQSQLGLMRALRGMVQEDGRVALLVVGVDPAIVRQSRWGTQGQQNPFFQFIREIHLGPLLLADCAQMIRIIGSQADLRCTAAASARVAEASGGHPFIARQLASLAFKLRHHTGQLEVDDVQRAEDQFLHDPMYASFLGELWSEVTSKRLWGAPAAKANDEVMLALARGERAVSASDLQSSGDDRLAALYELERRHVVQIAPGAEPDGTTAYAISFALLRRWIRQNLLRMGGG